MRTTRFKILFISFGVFFTILFLFFQTPSEAAENPLCARVKIEIRQEVTLERQAFDAHISINNGLKNITLENVGVDVTFTDEAGNPVLASSDPNYVGAQFYIRIDSTANINDVGGAGVVQPSSSADIHWLVIPAPGASNGLKQGTLYYVGAVLRYTIGGAETITEVSPDFIYVKPMPRLTLDYFLPADVYGDDAFTPAIEPIVPFSLGVRVKNTGFGTAKKLKIESAQPKIVENGQGLVVDFLITGSEVNGQSATPDLLVDFGDIDPQTSGVARWEMTSSLSGKFVEFVADFSHSDELGGEITSLIDFTNTHVLVHDVLVDLPGRDYIKDFLSSEPAGGYTVFESNSVDTPVADLSASSTLQIAGMSGTLTTLNTPGFIYVQLTDPFSGSNSIKEVIRSDGKRIKPENVWLSHTRYKSSPWQYFLNIFDVSSTGLYTVVFETPSPGSQPPVLQFIPDRTKAEGALFSFVVEASDPDGTIPLLTASSLPAGASFSDQGNNGNGIATGFFDWTPQPGQGGRYKVQFNASDGKLTDSQAVTLTVSCPGDTDCDGYTDVDEIAAGSNPDDPNSVPEITRLPMVAGYNQLTFPAAVSQYATLQNLIEALGGSAVISQVLVFYPEFNLFKSAGYDQGGILNGQITAPLPAQGISGLIVYTKQGVAALNLSSKYCPPWDLKAGFNLVGSPCVAPGLTAFKLLQNIGGESMVTSIQRFNPETGSFETANYQGNQPAGVDFSITPEDAYFINMNQDVLGFIPREAVQ